MPRFTRSVRGRNSPVGAIGVVRPGESRREIEQAGVFVGAQARKALAPGMAAQSEQAGVKDAAAAPIQRDAAGNVVAPDLRTPGQIFPSLQDRTYDFQMMAKFLQDADLDAAARFQSYRTNNPLDPEGFKTMADSYIKTVTEGMPPLFQNKFSEKAQLQAAGELATIEESKAKYDFEAAAATSANTISLHELKIGDMAQEGVQNPRLFEVQYQQIEAEWDRGIAANFYLPEQKVVGMRKVRQSILANYGTFEVREGMAGKDADSKILYLQKWRDDMESGKTEVSVGKFKSSEEFLGAGENTQFINNVYGLANNQIVRQQSNERIATKAFVEGQLTQLMAASVNLRINEDYRGFDALAAETLQLLSDPGLFQNFAEMEATFKTLGMVTEEAQNYGFARQQFSANKRLIIGHVRSNSALYQKELGSLAMSGTDIEAFNPTNEWAVHGMWKLPPNADAATIARSVRAQEDFLRRLNVSISKPTDMDMNVGRMLRDLDIARFAQIEDKFPGDEPLESLEAGVETFFDPDTPIQAIHQFERIGQSTIDYPVFKEGFRNSLDKALAVRYEPYLAEYGLEAPFDGKTTAQWWRNAATQDPITQDFFMRAVSEMDTMNAIPQGLTDLMKTISHRLTVGDPPTREEQWAFAYTIDRLGKNPAIRQVLFSNNHGIGANWMNWLEISSGGQHMLDSPAEFPGWSDQQIGEARSFVEEGFGAKDAMKTEDLSYIENEFLDDIQATVYYKNWLIHSGKEMMLTNKMAVAMKQIALAGYGRGGWKDPENAADYTMGKLLDYGWKPTRVMYSGQTYSRSQAGQPIGDSWYSPQDVGTYRRFVSGHDTMDQYTPSQGYDQFYGTGDDGAPTSPDGFEYWMQVSGLKNVEGIEGRVPIGGEYLLELWKRTPDDWIYRLYHAGNMENGNYEPTGQGFEPQTISLKEQARYYQDSTDNWWKDNFIPGMPGAYERQQRRQNIATGKVASPDD